MFKPTVHRVNPYINLKITLRGNFLRETALKQGPYVPSQIRSIHILWYCDKHGKID